MMYSVCFLFALAALFTSQVNGAGYLDSCTTSADCDYDEDYQVDMYCGNWFGAGCLHCDSDITSDDLYFSTETETIGDICQDTETNLWDDFEDAANTVVTTIIIIIVVSVLSCIACIVLLTKIACKKPATVVVAPQPQMMVQQ